MRLDASSPIVGAVSVSPDDGNDLTRGVCRGVWVGSSGDLAVVTFTGDEVTYANVQDGSLIPCFISRVKSTGTTASDILALY